MSASRWMCLWRRRRSGPCPWAPAWPSALEPLHTEDSDDMAARMRRPGAVGRHRRMHGRPDLPPAAGGGSRRVERRAAHRGGGAHAAIAQWWTTFKEPMLESLIARAVQSNLDLR